MAPDPQLAQWGSRGALVWRQIANFLWSLLEDGDLWSSSQWWTRRSSGGLCVPPGPTSLFARGAAHESKHFAVCCLLSCPWTKCQDVLEVERARPWISSCFPERLGGMPVVYRILGGSWEEPLQCQPGGRGSEDLSDLAAALLLWHGLAGGSGHGRGDGGDEVEHVPCTEAHHPHPACLQQKSPEAGTGLRS